MTKIYFVCEVLFSCHKDTSQKYTSPNTLKSIWNSVAYRKKNNNNCSPVYYCYRVANGKKYAEVFISFYCYQENSFLSS